MYLLSSQDNLKKSDTLGCAQIRQDTDCEIERCESQDFIGWHLMLNVSMVFGFLDFIIFLVLNWGISACFLCKKNFLKIIVIYCNVHYINKIFPGKPTVS